MLVASMNPCPCGYLGDQKNQCRCSIPQVQKYRAKISGPLLDRIDLHVEAPAVDLSELSNQSNSECSDTVRERVEQSRMIQKERFQGNGIISNAFMMKSDIDKFCKLSTDNHSLLINAMNKLSLSARAYDRILKVSRTIADMESSKDIKKEHILEAIQYRNLDRQKY